jgi:hypothetical protein
MSTDFAVKYYYFYTAEDHGLSSTNFEFTKPEGRHCLILTTIIWKRNTIW